MATTLLIFPTETQAARERKEGLPSDVEICTYCTMVGKRADLIVFVTPDAGLSSPRARGAYELAKTRVNPGGRLVIV